MIVSAEEQALYDKWHARLTQIIQDKYGNHPYFKPRIINNLAKENARYFTSVMTPTSLDYTVSYQQLNYMCHWMEHFSEQENPLYQMLKPTADEFLNIVDSLGYLDPQMVDGKGRGFSLIAKRARQEQFGEVYSVNYLGSYAMLAQAHRTRPLSYEMMRTEDKHYFIPEFLKEYPELVEEWIQDMKTVADLVPQGELVQINERGNYENLIIKARERLCTAAQFETMHLTHQTMQKIAQNTDNEEVKKDLQQVMCGARCLTGYKCANPCGFKPGIDLSRTI